MPQCQIGEIYIYQVLNLFLLSISIASLECKAIISLEIHCFFSAICVLFIVSSEATIKELFCQSVIGYCYKYNNLQIMFYTVFGGFTHHVKLILVVKILQHKRA